MKFSRVTAPRSRTRPAAGQSSDDNKIAPAALASDRPRAGHAGEVCERVRPPQHAGRRPGYTGAGGPDSEACGRVRHGHVTTGPARDTARVAATRSPGHGLSEPRFRHGGLLRTIYERPVARSPAPGLAARHVTVQLSPGLDKKQARAVASGGFRVSESWPALSGARASPRFRAGTQVTGPALTLHCRTWLLKSRLAHSARAGARRDSELSP